MDGVLWQFSQWKDAGHWSAEDCVANGRSKTKHLPLGLLLPTPIHSSLLMSIVAYQTLLFIVTHIGWAHITQKARI